MECLLSSNDVLTGATVGWCRRSEVARVDPRYAYPQPTYRNYQTAPDYYKHAGDAAAARLRPPAPPRPPVYHPPRGRHQGGPVAVARRGPRALPTGTAPGDDLRRRPPGPPPAVAGNNTGASNNPYRL